MWWTQHGIAILRRFGLSFRRPIRNVRPQVWGHFRPYEFSRDHFIHDIQDQLEEQLWRGVGNITEPIKFGIRGVIRNAFGIE